MITDVLDLLNRQTTSSPLLSVTLNKPPGKNGDAKSWQRSRSLFFVDFFFRATYVGLIERGTTPSLESTGWALIEWKGVGSS